MAVQISSVASRFSLFPQVSARLQSDAWFYYAVLGYTLIGVLFLFAIGESGGTSHFLYIMPGIKGFLILMPIVALGYDAVSVVVRFDQRRSLAFKRTFSHKRTNSMVAGLLVMTGVIVFQGTFTSIKTSLPQLFDGFPYDRLHADIDAMLHFGVDPWRYFQPIAESLLISSFVDFNYSVIWFALCFGILFFVATSPRADGIRVRYLLMFMFVWIVVGNLMAGAFLSAGPVYYGEVTGDHDRFAELLAMLAQTEGLGSAHNYQQYLWMLYDANKPGIGSGISAFPSVHVALAAMNAFFILERSRLLGLLAFAYVAFVLASSVFLGWHYAIDGYASIAVVAAGHYGLRRYFGGPRPDSPREKPVF